MFNRYLRNSHPCREGIKWVLIVGSNCALSLHLLRFSAFNIQSYQPTAHKPCANSAEYTVTKHSYTVVCETDYLQ